jgi:hypothetical protein
MPVTLPEIIPSERRSYLRRERRRKIKQTAQRILGSKTSVFGANDRLKRHYFLEDIRLRETEGNMQTAQARPKRAPRLSPDLAASLHLAKEVAARLRQHVGRFGIYDLLEEVYSVYVDWKRRHIAKRSARTLADELNMAWRKGMSPIRAIIEAVKPDNDFKQKSRWVRALEYVYSQAIPAKESRKFVRRHEGIAGCARLAVQVRRKRRRPRRDCPEGDWTD